MSTFLGMEFQQGDPRNPFVFHQAPSTSSSENTGAIAAVEKEHMFDKVVTPSDVGKLNRLVIPKQHAEKHFPLDPSFSDKGLSLCFEDNTGKQWRFRYSYWTSSQSYVMTKGWSRFVKEKRLDAGDTVTFMRGLNESYRHRLFIDWKRRPELPMSPHLHQNPAIMSFARSVLPWTSFLPSSSRGYLPSSSDAVWYLRSAAVPAQVPIVLNSVPVIPRSAAAKRVRLFGVNLDSRVKEEVRLDNDLRLSLGISQVSESKSKDKKNTMSLELKM